MIRFTTSIAFAFLITTQAMSDIRLEVRAGGHDRINCPVILPVPDALLDNKSFRLVRESDEQEIAVQRFGAKKNAKLVWVIDRLEAGSRIRYRLSGSPQWKRPEKTVSCTDDGKHLTVSVEGSPILRFNHAVVEAPEGIKPIYRRSGYFHPIFTPHGNVVTGDFEPDHAHQHGLFNAWVNTSFRERDTDFWNQAKGKGDVEFTEFRNRMVSGPVFAQFHAKLTHVAIIDGERVPAMQELIQVRVFNAKPFLFDITSRQSLTSEDPVIVREHHYGGFGIRGPSTWLLPKNPNSSNDTDHEAAGGFLTSENRTREDGNHTRARWVEMHGPVGSGHAGIMVLGAPSNFRAPQTVRLHPSKPYFCFAPMALGEFTLEPGDQYVSRFRYVVHDGGADAELGERSWQDLAHPPKVSIIDENQD